MKRRGVQVMLAAVALTVAVCGCTAQAGAAPSSSPTINWTAKLAAFTAKYGENPASDPPYTDAQATAAAASFADRQWAILLQTFPQAVRPTDSFVHWTSSDDPDRVACVTAAASTPGSDSSPPTAAPSIAIFDCEFVRYPVRQSPPPNAAQVSYYYDYLTHYLVPCYLAHGATIDPGMPTRAQFIAQFRSGYVGARWQLTPPDAGDAPDPTYDGPSAVCSAIAPGGAEP